MSAIYIKEQGAFVQKSGDRLLVTKNKARLFEIPVFQVENICLIGNVQVSTQALHMMMENGIDITYLSYSGKYLGHTSADMSRNIFLRFEQYQIYLDNDRRMAMAKTITANKIRNQMEIIRQHRWTGSEYEWKADVIQLLTRRKKESGYEWLIEL